jgi:tetratricopeptide (TPR) repeat protein
MWLRNSLYRIPSRRETSHNIVRGEANCIKRLGDIALACSDQDTARARYEQALPLYRRVGDVLREANCIKSLGNIAQDRFDHGAARARYEEALPLYRHVGNLHGEANCMLGQGDLSLAQGDKAEAERHFRVALAIYERICRIDNIALSQERLASITEGTERAAHVQAGREAWLSMGLPAEAERVSQLFA